MARGRRGGGGGMDALRDAFSAANLRAIMGVVDRGRVLLARVQRTAGEVVESDGRDAFLHLVDVLHELPLMARLFIPMNILWRKPVAGEHAAVVVPADLNSPGGPVALYGDAGGAGAVPPWWGTKAGIYSPETAVVQSKDGDVELEVTASGKKVKLGAAATKAVNREGDPTDNGCLVFLPNVGTAAAQLQFFPPGATVPPVVPPAVRINLTGKTGAGSSKVKAED